MKRVAIVGFWEGTRDQAPYADRSFEVWSLNHAHPYVARWDRWFDFHPPEWSAKNLVPSVWQDQDRFLREKHGKPIYMLQAHPDYPDVLAYPLEAVLQEFPRRYLTSGIAYMLALALHERFEEIHLYGVDMRHDTEYALQRPCCEYYLGVAEGRGVKVYVPPPAAILTFDCLYGYEEESSAWIEMRRAHEEVLKTAIEGKNKALAEAQTYDGVIQTEREWLRRIDERRRGGVL